MKNIYLLLFAVLSCISSRGQVAAVTGPAAICVGLSGTYSDATPGGTWSSSASAVLSIGSASGVALSHSLGVATISYTVGGSSATYTVNVVTTPTMITGPSSVCIGTSATYADGVAGGVWSSSAATVATIGTGGTLNALSAGITNISYAFSAGCAVWRPVTVDVLPLAGPISGSASICAGATSTFSVSATGGTWGSSSPSVASISSTGLATGIAGGIDTISYTTSSSCGTAATFHIVTVSPIVVPSVIVTASPGITFCPGTTTTFSAAITGGGSSPTYLWFVNGITTASTPTYAYIPSPGDIVYVVITSSDPCATATSAASLHYSMVLDIASITATSSVACGGVNTLTASGGISYSWAPTTGLSCGACSNPTVLPTSTTTYTVTGTDAAGCTGTATVTANGNTISGYISYSGGSSTDSFRVWLIQYDPTDSSVIATDSTVSCMDGSIPYYEFNSPAAGSYLVKAALFGAVPGTSGYIPTYGLSSAYWYSASGISHSSSADSMHINMISGTVPPGPGFISGYVYAGAGKGTTGDAPDPGILIYLKDAITGNVITYTYTDGAGLYSFGSVATGSYIIYPEDYRYYTTPSTVINISSGSTSVTGIDFRRSTTTGTIKPKPTGILQIAKTLYYIAPNPTNGDVSVTWPVATGDAIINVTDLTGRTVYHDVFNANTGKAAISLVQLQNGIYFIAVKTDAYNYDTKLLIQK